MLNLIAKTVQRRFVVKSLFNKNNAIQKNQLSTIPQARNFHHGSAIASNQADIFQELGINPHDIEWPVQSDSNNESVNYRSRNPCSIENMYGDSDLSQLPVFKKLINFGFWQGIGLHALSESKREKSSKRLYRKVAEESRLTQGYNVVCDVGCGNGIGTAEIMQAYQPAVMVGVDISSAQIHRANLYNKDVVDKFTVNRLNFIQSAAEYLPFQDNSFTNVMAVESPHHFHDLDKFFSEVARILQPKTGKFVCTTFFPNDEKSIDIIEKVIPDAELHCSSIDINRVKSMLSKHMDNVEIESIGEDVWWGLHCWLKHIGYEKQWTALWWPLYEHGVLDYYVVKADAPCNTFKDDKKFIENTVENNNIDEYDNDKNEESYTPRVTM